MASVIAEQVFSQPIADAELVRLARRLDDCLEIRNGAWVRSYVSADGTRMTCEFDAPDAESVREAFRSAGIPFERVWATSVFAVESYPEQLGRLQKVRATRASTST